MRKEAVNTHLQERIEPSQKHGNFGKVPAYLQTRKDELADKEAARQAALEAEDLPPGMKLLSEAERVAMLRKLEDSKKEVLGDLQKLPLTVETPSHIRHRNSLEDRLKEVED